MKLRFPQLALAGASLVLAGLAGQSGALAYWRSTPPDDVPALWADDPHIVMARAEPQLPVLLQSPARTQALESTIRQVLRNDPLNPKALYELGMIREAHHPGSGEPLLLIAESVSRRESVNELALENIKATGGDLAGAISRLDRVFSVQPQLTDQLIPSFAPLLSDPLIRQGFAAYAARSWYPALLRAAIAANVSPPALAAMIDGAVGRQDAGLLDDLRTRLFTQVIANRDYGAAASLMAALPAGTRLALGRIGLSRASLDPRLGPMGWNLLDNATGTAQFIGNGGVMLSVAPEQVQTLAERTTLLAPGSYMFSQTLAYDSAAPMAMLTWDIACVTGEATPIWHQPVPYHYGRITWRSAMTIPAGCPAQHWRLQALGEASDTASQATIVRLDLARVP